MYWIFKEWIKTYCKRISLHVYLIVCGIFPLFLLKFKYPTQSALIVFAHPHPQLLPDLPFVLLTLLSSFFLLFFGNQVQFVLFIYYLIYSLLLECGQSTREHWLPHPDCISHRAWTSCPPSFSGLHFLGLACVGFVHVVTTPVSL